MYTTTLTLNPGFTFDGCYIVGGCEDGKALLFEADIDCMLISVVDSGLHIFHTETGDVVHTFKTAGSCEAVAWAPTRYCLAYSDLGVLRIVGVDTERK